MKIINCTRKRHECNGDDPNEWARAFVAALHARRRFTRSLAEVERLLPDERQNGETKRDALEDDQINRHWRSRVGELANYRDRLVALAELPESLQPIFCGCDCDEIAQKIAETIVAWRDWQQARCQFAKLNFRYVVKEAVFYWLAVRASWQTRRLEFDELVVAGHIGLMKAIDAFDATRGGGFPDLIVPWIRRELQNQVEKQAFKELSRDQANRVASVVNNLVNGCLTRDERYATNDEIEALTRREKDERQVSTPNAAARTLIEIIRERWKANLRENDLLDWLKEHTRKQFLLAMKQESFVDPKGLNLAPFFKNQLFHRVEVCKVCPNSFEKFVELELALLAEVSRQRRASIVCQARRKFRGPSTNIRRAPRRLFLCVAPHPYKEGLTVLSAVWRRRSNFYFISETIDE